MNQRLRSTLLIGLAVLTVAIAFAVVSYQSTQDIATLKSQVGDQRLVDIETANDQRLIDIDKANVARIKALKVVCKRDARSNRNTAHVRTTQAHGDHTASKDRKASVKTRIARRRQSNVEKRSAAVFAAPINCEIK